MIDLLQTALATPLWLRLAVILVIGLCVAFPAVALAFVRTEAGRAALLGGIAIIAICWFRAAAFTDGRATERRAWEARIAEQAMKRSQETIRAAHVSAEASDAARAATGERTATINQTRRTAEGFAREPRPPVPAVCPSADPRLVRESHEAADRIAAAEDRLRGLRAAGSGDPNPPGTR